MPLPYPQQQRLELMKREQPMREGGNPVTGYKVEMAGMTDRGLVRSSNEDSFVVLQEPALPSHYLAVAGVFDGVGGQAHGARASTAAANCLAQLVADPALPHVSLRAPKVELEELMQQLHKMAGAGATT